MSSSTPFQTNSKVVKWIESRLPIISTIDGALVSYPAPRNLNYWWNFG
jgi:quinol-cytochrome oxidoreductase complex cytochrome b subunit